MRSMTSAAIGTETQRKNPATGQQEKARVGGIYDDYLTRVAAYGSPEWSYAAFLYRSNVLIHLARSIYDAPRPPDLDEDEEEAYEEVLQGLGAPIENRAVEPLEAGMEDAIAKKVTNEWLNRMRTVLNRYKPKQYPLAKGGTPAPAQAAEVVLAHGAAVMRVIARKNSLVRGCYEAALEARPSLNGTIKVKFVVGTAGTVTDVSTPGASGGFSSCLKGRFMQIRGLPRSTEPRSFTTSYALTGS